MKAEPRFAISERWIACVDLLLKGGELASYKAFCESIRIKPQSLNDIKAARRAVTLDILVDTCHAYRINPNYLLTGAGEPLLPAVAAGPALAYRQRPQHPRSAVMEAAPTGWQPGQPGEEPLLFPLIDSRAAADYVARYQQPAFYAGLAAVTLPPALVPGGQPGIVLQLPDESMAPTFPPQAWVAGTPLSRPEWARLREGEYLLVVSRTAGIQLRRVQGRQSARERLRCQPDNPRFPATDLAAADLLQLFRPLFQLPPAPGSPPAGLPRQVARLEADTAALRQQLRQLQSRLDTLDGTAAPEC